MCRDGGRVVGFACLVGEGEQRPVLHALAGLPRESYEAQGGGAMQAGSSSSSGSSDDEDDDDDDADDLVESLKEQIQQLQQQILEV